MELMEVWHNNFIGHEINESLQLELPTSDREVYCRKLNKITEPLKKDCDNCPYMGGWMMGNGHCCKWKDVPPEDGGDEVYIPHDQRRQEMLRVNKLVDQGILEKMGE